MNGTVAEILIWLFVLNLGIVFGAGLYESRVVHPLWAANPPASIGVPDAGRNFWVFATTVPLTLLCIANLYAAWQSGGFRGKWWLIAAVVVAVERLMTFAYFIPTILQLQNNSDAVQARVKFSQWVLLNYLRLALILAGWLAALRTLTLPFGL